MGTTVGTAVSAAVRASDPLSRPYTLPSRGIYYPAGHGGKVLIAPSRGEQEEIIAGAADNPAAQLEALRHVTSQCVSVGAFPFDSLILEDWCAAMLHFLAMSAGDDRIGLRPVHSDCGAASPQMRSLTSLPCTLLRIAEPGEKPNWPPEPIDPDLAVLREMEEEEKLEAGGPVERVMSAEDAHEPFTTAPLPGAGEVISFRYLRLSDLKRAEEYSARLGEATMSPGSKLHTFQLAMQIVAINGNKVSGGLEAATWVKRQPTPVLTAFRKEIARRSFGYDMSPRFRCNNCKLMFRSKLPLDGSIFRSGADT